MAFGLSACGGGGRRRIAPIPPAPTPTPTPDPTPTPHPHTDAHSDPHADADTEHELTTRPSIRRRNYSVAANAIAAYNAGATGKGMKIGIVDSGINPSLSEFAGRIDPASGDVAGNRGVSDEGGHGTAVTAVAAAARNGQNTMGVAFDATIVSERADESGSCAADGRLPVLRHRLSPRHRCRAQTPARR